MVVASGGTTSLYGCCLLLTCCGVVLLVLCAQVVPALLRAMFSLLDRLAGLQLALQPPSITHTYTGAAVVSYGVPMASKLCEMLCLGGQLAAAVADVLEAPSCANSERVQEMVSCGTV